MRLTPDGLQEVASWVNQTDICCMPSTCYDPCETACHLIWSLPSGPMWDAQKTAAVERVRTENTPPFDLCRPMGDCEPARCGGLADYALFMAQMLAMIINDGIWAARRESNPFTAKDTIQDWMDRFGWEDCFRSICRDTYQGQITPYEIEGACGPVYCPPVIPEDLDCAVRAGIVKALARARMGFIENLAGINWVIEPLGAEVTVRPNGKFMICPSDGMIDACAPANCWEVRRDHKIPACLDQTCSKEIEQPDIIWPGVIAAECIVRTFLPTCPDPIVRCFLPRWETCSVVAPDRPDPPEPAFGECGVPSETLPRGNPNLWCGVP